MEPDNPTQTITLVLTCLNGPECVVSFEPWGSQHVLRREDRFTVSVTAPAPIDSIEVSYGSDGIIVCLLIDGEITVTNRAGESLPL
ncbi:hypothetical protein [Streptomyces sp. NPDC048340]|uniref:hypothetical protein n=1 Tax=Streptomyces sp. NPDC048340 TaxID=3365537 RepID=UPI0037121634